MFIVKVPGVNGNPDAKLAGNAVLKELKKIELNSRGKEIDFPKMDLEEIHLDDSNSRLTNKLIYENAFEIYGNYPRVIFLGGDGSISYSLTRAFLDYSESFGKEASLIIFDSFLDCKKTENFASNRNWLRKVIEDGFNPKNILIVGVNNLGKEEFNFIKEKGIRIFPNDKFLLDLEESCDVIMEFSSGKKLYVSLDFNVLKNNGINERELIYLTSRINKMRNLCAFDLTEITKDDEVKLGAKIVSELV